MAFDASTSWSWLSSTIDASAGAENSAPNIAMIESRVFRKLHTGKKSYGHYLFGMNLSLIPWCNTCT